MIPTHAYPGSCLDVNRCIRSIAVRAVRWPLVDGGFPTSLLPTFQIWPPSNPPHPRVAACPGAKRALIRFKPSGMNGSGRGMDGPFLGTNGPTLGLKAPSLGSNGPDPGMDGPDPGLNGPDPGMEGPAPGVDNSFLGRNRSALH